MEFVEMDATKWCSACDPIDPRTSSRWNLATLTTDLSVEGALGCALAVSAVVVAILALMFWPDDPFYLAQEEGSWVGWALAGAGLGLVAAVLARPRCCWGYPVAIAFLT